MIAAKTPWPLDKIQGLLLRGYRENFVRYFALSVREPAAARGFIASLVNGQAGVPQVTTAAPWAIKPECLLNIGFTFRGLGKLQVPQASLDRFESPNSVDIRSFALGAAARAGKAPNGVGDVNESDPSNWIVSDQDFDVLLVLYAHSTDAMERLSDGLREKFSPGFDCPKATAQFDGQALDDGRVYFGYKDGIAQPYVKGSPFAHEPDGGQPAVDPGAFLMGEAEPGGAYSTMVLPTPEALAHYGCFGSFRILRQDVEGFETQVESLAPMFGQQFGVTDPDLQKEAVKAVICGRWTNGTPLMVSPINGNTPPKPLPPQSLNDFMYGSDAGQKCPIGAHIRRGNPRDTVGINGTVADHRVLRRAMPYQIPYDPENRHTGERGLIGLFMGASFLKQFEFVMENWINNPQGFSLVVDPTDPTMGTNALPDSSGGFTFSETVPTATNKNSRLKPMSSFVHTKGSAYCFFPGIDGIRWIAQNGS